MSWWRPDFPGQDAGIINDDWILETVKKAISEFLNIKKEFENLKTAVAELHEYVDNYFKNLDVSKEISDKLDSMYESGELAQLFKSYVSVCPEMYGAKGDGETDDTAAIQTCINENPNNNIVFKSPIYLISSPITVNVKGITQSIDLGNAKLITNTELDYMIEILGSDTTGSTNQSVCKLHGGTIECNSKAKIGLYDQSKLTVVEALNVLNAVDIAIKIGYYSDDIASGAQKYSNINVGRTVQSEYNTGIGIQIGNPDIQFTNINIARYQKSVDIQSGGCCFNNIHLTAQFPSKQACIPHCVGFNFSTPVTYRNNTSITNAYFDALKYCFYFESNTGMVNISNSFYLLDPNLFDSEKTEVFMIGGTYGSVNVDNFNICGTTEKLNFKDNFSTPSTYDLTYCAKDYNRRYFNQTEIIDAGNLKGPAIICSASHPLTANMYKRIGKIVTPIVNESTNYFYPELMHVTMCNREYGILKCDMIFNSTNNDFTISNKQQTPASFNDIRLFIKKGRNPIEIEGIKYNENDLYIYGNGLNGLTILEIIPVTNYTRVYIRTIPDDNDVFNEIDNLQEITN